MTSDPVRLSQWQRNMLDGLPPEQRHAWSDLWHLERYRLLAQADLMDRCADLVSRAGPIGRLDDDYMVAQALHAEGLRAVACDDLERAGELFESSGQYDAELGASGTRSVELLREAAKPWRSGSPDDA